MKRVTLFLIAVLMTATSIGQVYPKFYPKNTVMVQFMPFQSSNHFDLGLGLRYTRQLQDVIGIYGSAAYVNHRLHYGGYIHDHIRTALGGVYYTKPEFGKECQFSVSAGIVYSHYGDMELTIPEWTADLFYPLSFEVGVSMRIFERYIFFKNFNAGFSFDFMKNEACVNFGYSF